MAKATREAMNDIGEAKREIAVLRSRGALLPGDELVLRKKLDEVRTVIADANRRVMRLPREPQKRVEHPSFVGDPEPVDHPIVGGGSWHAGI